MSGGQGGKGMNADRQGQSDWRGEDGVYWSKRTGSRRSGSSGWTGRKDGGTGSRAGRETDGWRRLGTGCRAGEGWRARERVVGGAGLKWIAVGCRKEWGREGKSWLVGWIGRDWGKMGSRSGGKCSASRWVVVWGLAGADLTGAVGRAGAGRRRGVVRDGTGGEWIGMACRAGQVGEGVEGIVGRDGCE